MLTIVASHFRWASDSDGCMIPYHHADVPFAVVDDWNKATATLAELNAANPLLSFRVRPIVLMLPEVYPCPDGFKPLD